MSGEPDGMRAEIEQLRQRLARAENVIDALQGGEVDAVVGRHQVALLRLREAEEELRRLNRELESRVEERTAEAEQRAAQLRAMALELTHAEERERRRMAQYLHDNLQQHLVGIRLRLGTLEMTDHEVGSELRELGELVGEAIRASRSLARELSPQVLYREGLAEALRWLAGWMGEMHGLEVAALVEDVAPDEPRLEVFLFQAARELLFNVVKHSAVSEAALRLSADDDRLRLVVTDGGRGFDPGRISQRSGRETGLGLVSIRERAVALGGEVEISSAVGDGTQVVVEVPWHLTTAVEGSPAVPDDATPGLGPAPADRDGRIRVLLVDDHRVMRHGLSSLLSRQRDLEVVGEASNGLEGVEMALELAPDVVLMDVSMPEMDGREATRRITAARDDVRVIGLSMFDEDHVKAQMLEAGAVAFLSKAGSSDLLLATIRDNGSVADGA